MEKDILKELVKFQFPSGVLDYFELVSVKQEDGKLGLMDKKESRRGKKEG